MGYRAQVVTQHREYGSSIFSNWDQFDSYYVELHDLYPDGNLFGEENSDFYEIGKDIVESEIERLKKLGPAEDFEFQPSWGDDYKDSNQNIIDAWEAALKESPENSEYVALEWY